MINRTVEGRPLRWIKELPDYYFRDEWEMFDLERDPYEMVNLKFKKKYKVSKKNRPKRSEGISLLLLKV